MHKHLIRSSLLCCTKKQWCICFLPFWLFALLSDNGNKILFASFETKENTHLLFLDLYEYIYFYLFTQWAAKNKNILPCQFYLHVFVVQSDASYKHSCSAQFEKWLIIIIVYCTCLKHYKSGNTIFMCMLIIYMLIWDMSEQQRGNET